MSMVSVHGGDCGPSLLFGRSDFVGFAARQQHSFANLVAAHSPDIAIIGLGAHIEDLGDFYDMHRRVTSYLKDRQASNQTVPQVIFKTINSPHLSCNNYDTPLTEFPTFELATAEDEFHFQRLYKLDREMRTFVVNETESGFKLLSMEPLYFRPDAHVHGSKKDCMYVLSYSRSLLSHAFIK